MIEALKDDKIMTKVGGRFKFAALVQHRVRELMEGARPLVDRDGRSDFEVAVQEIVEEKIALRAYDASDDFDQDFDLDAPVDVELAAALGEMGVDNDFTTEGLGDEEPTSEEIAAVEQLLSQNTDILIGADEAAAETPAEETPAAEETVAEAPADEAPAEEEKPAE